MKTFSFMAAAFFLVSVGMVFKAMPAIESPVVRLHSYGYVLLAAASIIFCLSMYCVREAIITRHNERHRARFPNDLTLESMVIPTRIRR